MANGHDDMNVPMALVPFVGSLLGLLERYLIDQGWTPRVRHKQAGGHATDFWLYLHVNGSSRKDRVVFGETLHDAGNPAPHLYVRGSDEARRAGLQLLQTFFNATLPKELCT